MFKKRNFQRRNFRGRVKNFDPSHIVAQSFMSSEKVSKEPEYIVKYQFSEMGLDQSLLRNVLSRGYKIPTPIQDQTIPEILKGRDVVGVANTGTGKTAAFLIPLIDKIKKNRNSKILIIAPTRELAVQIDTELQSFVRGLGIYSVVCIGGMPIRKQIYGLNRNPHFVIGTPGRLLDLNDQRKLSFYRFSNVVLDEVDRMLDMGFVHDVEKIVNSLPQNRQSLFFSATLAGNVIDVMKRFVKNPVNISVKTTDILSNVSQKVIKVNGQEKISILKKVLDEVDAKKVLVFSRTKHGADKLQKYLSQDNFLVEVIHGNKTQNQRQKALDFFKKGKINVLIATDVASRGIDVGNITHVVNYDLPASYEDYIHRIGRTGRAGKTGIALTLV